MMFEIICLKSLQVVATALGSKALAKPEAATLLKARRCTERILRELCDTTRDGRKVGKDREIEGLCTWATHVPLYSHRVGLR